MLKQRKKLLIQNGEWPEFFNEGLKTLGLALSIIAVVATQ